MVRVSDAGPGMTGPPIRPEGPSQRSPGESCGVATRGKVAARQLRPPRWPTHLRVPLGSWSIPAILLPDLPDATDDFSRTPRPTARCGVSFAETAMLRYFTYAERDFRRSPDHSDYRLNWEFWIAFRSKVHPVFHDEAHRQVEPANFWVMPPNLRYHWHVVGGKTERAVLHFAFVPEPLQQLVRWRGHFSLTLSADELREARAIADAVAAASRRRD
eukprot:gene30855-53072_t